jgi:hypothetical protein
MKGLHLTLRLTQFHSGRKGFADGLSVDLASQAEVRAVTGLVGLMTTTVWLSATAIDGGDGAAAKITKLENLHEDAGTLLFEGDEGVRQMALPILTHSYVRIITTKKENCRIIPCESHTHNDVARGEHLNNKLQWVAAQQAGAHRHHGFQSAESILRSLPVIWSSQSSNFGGPKPWLASVLSAPLLKWLFRNFDAKWHKTSYIGNVLMLGRMAHPSSHSQSLLPNPDSLILDRIERDANRFRFMVHVEQKPVRRWLRRGEFPERKPPHRRPPKVNEFGDYLQQRWNEGCHNASRLYHEIREKGYPGKRAMVARFVAGWRRIGKAVRPNAPERISPNHAAILVTRAADQMTDEQQRLFERIATQCPDVVGLRQIALAFRAGLTAGESGKLRQWIEGAKRCEFGPVVRFAYGLHRDISAVAAAVETSWSTGQVEGQINRLKIIKRQMYGRPGFELLRARVLPYLPTAASGPAP